MQAKRPASAEPYLFGAGEEELRHIGRPLTTSQVSAYLGFGGNLTLLLAQLYLNLGRRRQVTDWDQEPMASEILFNRARAEITSDPTRLFFESIAALRHFNEIDAGQVEQASAIYASAAGMFCYSGISFSIGKRIMRRARALVHEGNVQQAFTCASMEFIIGYLEGDWADGHVVDESLLDGALRNGHLPRPVLRSPSSPRALRRCTHRLASPGGDARRLWLQLRRHQSRRHDRHPAGGRA